MLQNPATVTGTPTLVAGALTDGNQALQFNGTTQSVTVPDSVSSSLTVADGVTGGMAVELWVRFTSYPSINQYIIQKSNSYGLYIGPDGKLRWLLVNGANSVTVTSNQTVSLNAWHQVVGVYNGDYSGTPQLGRTTAGSTLLGLQGDYRAGNLTGANNLEVSRFQAQENGRVSSIAMRLAIDPGAPYSQDCAAVMYGDLAGEPDEKISQSDGQLLVSSSLGGPIPLSNASSVWWVFPAEGNIYQGSFYWLGYAGGALHTSDFTVLVIGATTTGGSLRGKNSVVSESNAGPASQSVDDPFGTAALSNTTILDVYANYTPTSRTGAEGRALLYVDGALDNFASYTRGVADTANATVMAQNLAVQLDDVSIWNRKLTGEEVATHYASR
jgi:hypothetical protein